MTSYPSSRFQRVLIVGATHGNELTGAYVVQKLQRSPTLAQRPTFETITLIANPKALAAVRRYIDTDLNRCFRPQDLQDVTRCTYEEVRSRNINNRFGKDGETPADVILDLHSTTAAMGLTLITYRRPFNLQLASYVQQQVPSVKVLVVPEPEQGYAGLRSICGLGCTIEVGPIATGILQADLFQQTETLVHHALNYVDHANQGKMPKGNSELTVYQQIGSIDYPRDEDHQLRAMIHPQRQFQDYKPLYPGDPLFLSFEGDRIDYSGDEVVYPVFINEAAYYEKGIAMILTRKQQILIDPIEPR
ncbi:MAG: aspartoacylase [Synechococcales cyanobacterium T60_A2020_003]|nr:aspartoacylase [Synechococcales cyanobacterium T60_A2020_003]